MQKVEDKKTTYAAVHQWLGYRYKHPSVCSDCGLVGSSRNGMWTVEWALKKGYKYKKCIHNFIPLCASCHRKYDATEEWHKNIGLAQTKTHCRRGHELSEDNVYIYRNRAHKGRRQDTQRVCKQCNVIRNRERRLLLKTRKQ